MITTEVVVGSGVDQETSVRGSERSQGGLRAEEVRYVVGMLGH